jgi:hypothetical protein
VEHAGIRDAAEEGGGNGTAIDQARAIAEGAACMIGVQGTPRWTSVPNDGQLSRLEDVDFAHVCAASGPYRPGAILHADCGGATAIVLEEGSVVVLDVEQGFLWMRQMLAVGENDEDLADSLAVYVENATGIALRGDQLVVTAQMDEEIVTSFVCSRGTWVSTPSD